MSYNRWMPREYQNGGELYHYGVKGMRWKHHKARDVAKAAYDAMGGSAERDLEDVDDRLFSDDARNLSPQERAALVDERNKKLKKYLTSPVGRLKEFRSRMSEIRDDIVYDQEAKTPKQKGKLILDTLFDYMKNG